MIAFLISVTAGSAIGAICALWHSVEYALSIPVAFVRSLPVVSVIMLCLFWLNSRDIPPFVAVLTALPIMISASCNGLKSYDKTLLEMAKVFRLNTVQCLLTIRLLPFLSFMKNAFMTSYGLIWKVVAAAEVLSLPKWGLGTALYTQQVNLEAANVFAISISIVALGYITQAVGSLALSFLFSRKNKLFFHIYILLLCPRKKKKIVAVPTPVDIKNKDIYIEGKLLFPNFNLHLNAGSITALMGKSGVGKTTLLSYIANNYNGRVAMAFQEPRLLPCLTVELNVALPLFNTMTQEEALKKTRTWLSKMQIGHLKDCLVQNISGGERQRVNLCRAIAFNASLILLDEAFKSLDLALANSLYNVVKEAFYSSKATVLIATHSKQEASNLASSIIELKREEY